MANLKFRCIVFILILNDLLEIGRRCQDSPTRIVRVKVGPMSGTVNVAEIYTRMKKNSLDKCVFNTTHFKDHGNLKFMSSFDEANPEMDTKLRNAMVNSVYVLVDMKAWNLSTDDTVRPFFFVESDDTNYRIMDLFTFKEFIVKPELIKKAIQYKHPYNFDRIPNKIDFHYLRERFARDLQEIYRNRNAIEKYYQINQDYEKMILSSLEYSDSGVFVNLKNDVNRFNLSNIYQMEKTNSINGTTYGYLQNIGTQERIKTKMEDLIPVKGFKKITFNHKFEISDKYGNFTILNETSQVITQNPHLIHFRLDQNNTVVVPIYFVKTWEYEDDKNNTLIINHLKDDVPFRVSEDIGNIPKYKAEVWENQIILIARFKRFEDLEYLPTINTSNEKLTYYQCIQNSFEFNANNPKTIKKYGVEKPVNLLLTLKPELYKIFNVVITKTTTTESTITVTGTNTDLPTILHTTPHALTDNITLKTNDPVQPTNPSSIFMNAETQSILTTTGVSTKPSNAEEPVSPDGFTTITTTTTTTTTNPAVVTVEERTTIDRNASDIPTINQDTSYINNLYTGNSDSNSNQLDKAENNPNLTQHIPNTCVINETHYLIRNEATLIWRTEPNSIHGIENSELNIKYMRAYNNSLYAFVNLKHFDNSLSKHYYPFFLIENDGHHYRVVDEEIQNEFIIPEEYIGKIVSVKNTLKSPVSRWIDMKLHVYNNIGWIKFYSDKIEEYFRTIELIKTNEVKNLDETHQVIHNLYGNLSNKFVRIELEKCENSYCFEFIKHDSKRYKVLSEDVENLGFARTLRFEKEFTIENQTFIELFCNDVTRISSEFCGFAGQYILEIPNYFIKSVHYLHASINLWHMIDSTHFLDTKIVKYKNNGKYSQLYPNYYRIIPMKTEIFDPEPVEIPRNNMNVNHHYICNNETSKKDFLETIKHSKWLINLNITEDDYFDLTRIPKESKTNINSKIKTNTEASLLPKLTKINHIEKSIGTHATDESALLASSTEKLKPLIPVLPPYENQEFTNNLKIKTDEKRDISNIVESSNNYGYMFKATKAYKPLEDEFSKPGFIVRAASFGLTFSRTGRAYKFSDFWEQYLRIEGPQLNTETFELFKKNLYNICEDIGKRFENKTRNKRVIGKVDVMKNRPTVNGIKLTSINISTNFTKNCEKRVDNVYQDVIQQMTNVLKTRYNQFEKVNINRKRREILTTMLITAGVSLAAGFFLGKNNDDNEKEIEELSKRMENNEKRIELLAQQMIGMSHINNARFKELDEKIQYLANTTETAFKNMQEHYDKILYGIQNELQILTLNSDIQNLIFREADKLQNVLMLYLEDFRFWDNIFITLRKGLLPRELFDSFTLNNLLDQIEYKLKGDYLIALDKEDYVLFYNLPFVSYIVKNEVKNGTTKNYLYLKIKIPLKKNMEQNLFHIIHPSSSPFPCLNNGCFLKNETQNRLISFDLPQTVWLVNVDSGKIDEEADLSTFSCHRTFDEKLCFTYSPELLKSPTSCTKALHDWKENEILEYCKLERKNLGDYRVIKLNSHQYMIHSAAADKYQQKCDNQKVEEVKVEDWAQVINIKTKCNVYVPATRQTLYGMYSKPLNGSEDLVNYSFYNPLISNITEKIKKSELNIEINEIDIFKSHKLDDKELWAKLDVRMKDDKLSDLTKLSITMTKSLYENFNEMQSNFSNFKYRSTFWGIFAVIGDFIQVTATLFVIFSTLTYSRLFGHIGIGVVVIRPQPIQAISLLPRITLLPKIDNHVLEDVTFISWISKVILSILFIILLIFTITRKKFRTIKNTLHYGSYTPSRLEDTYFKFSIEINIHNYTQFFTYGVIEDVFIKIPVTKLSFENVFDIKCKNRLLTWHVVEENGQSFFTLSDSLHLAAMDRKGNRIKNTNEPIKIPMKKIKWTSYPEPECLRLKNNFDFAIIEILREPSLVRNQTPKRKFEALEEDSEGYVLPNASTTLL